MFMSSLYMFERHFYFYSKNTHNTFKLAWTVIRCMVIVRPCQCSTVITKNVFSLKCVFSGAQFM